MGCVAPPFVPWWYPGCTGVHASVTPAAEPTDELAPLRLGHAIKNVLPSKASPQAHSDRGYQQGDADKGFHYHSPLAASLRAANTPSRTPESTKRMVYRRAEKFKPSSAWRLSACSVSWRSSESVSLTSALTVDMESTPTG